MHLQENGTKQRHGSEDREAGGQGGLTDIWEPVCLDQTNEAEQQFNNKLNCYLGVTTELTSNQNGATARHMH